MKRPSTITNFKNIRVLPSGYQVSIVRAGTEFSKHFAGHSEGSRRAAINCRDKLLNQLPAKRLNPIPQRVLSALKLKVPVVGVFRHSDKEHFHVSYRDAKGHICSRAFTWTNRSQTEAYAAAVKFRKQITKRR